MLEQILKKLQCSSVEEFFEKEKAIIEKYAGMEIERRSPLKNLSEEEMDYFEAVILPAMAK